MQKLKIALILDDSLDSTDGVQQYILNLGQWLGNQGHEIHYLVGKTSRTDLPNIHSLGYNIPVSFNQNRMSVPLPTSRKTIRQLLRKERFDIIHVQMPYSPFLAGRIVQEAPRSTAIVGTFHVAPYGWHVSVANALLGKIVCNSLKHFDQVISVSPIAQSFAKKTHGIDSTVIPNTINLQPFNQAKQQKELKSRFTIMFLGRLVERKGAQHFLKAIFNLKQSGDLPANCSVLVCGKGPLSVGLQEYVSQHGLDEVVKFTGYVSEEEKPSYLASADILAYPSTGGESFGIVLLEGMAAGRGVVLGGDNPGYRSVMHDRPQQLFNPSKEDQFAAIMRLYIKDENLRSQARKWQKQYVQNFDLPQVGHKILKIYQQALHSHKA